MADVKDLKVVLRKLEYGVYVVSMGKGNEGNAFTASWVTQVSSEPPIVAISVNNRHKSIPMLKEQQAFVVNLLHKESDATARRYYGPAESGYEKLQTADLTESSKTGAPILNKTAGYLDCKIVNTVSAGNHTVFFGEVVDGMIKDKDVELMTSSTSKLRYAG